MTKVSFVCPIFNKNIYLSLVLDSIKNQTGEFEKEFIFIDDGSTDGSFEILKKETSKWRNTTILHQENKGPAIATQKGIFRATGDFVKLVGGDDIMSPNCTDLLLKLIIKTKTVAAFSRYKLLDNFLNIIHKNNKIKDYKVLKDPLIETIKSSFSGTTPNLYCNKALKISGGCEKNIFIEDFSLVLGLSRLGNFSFIDNVTSYGPKNDKKRIMVGKKTQLIHDYNAALYYFFKKNHDINKEINRLACIKSLGRTEKWFRREAGGSKINKMNYFKLNLYLGRSDYLNLIKESCLFFYKHSQADDIRYKVY